MTTTVMTRLRTLRHPAGQPAPRRASPRFLVGLLGRLRPRLRRRRWSRRRAPASAASARGLGRGLGSAPRLGRLGVAVLHRRVGGRARPVPPRTPARACGRRGPACLSGLLVGLLVRLLVGLLVRLLVRTAGCCPSPDGSRRAAVAAAGVAHQLLGLAAEVGHPLGQRLAAAVQLGQPRGHLVGTAPGAGPGSGVHARVAAIICHRRTVTGNPASRAAYSRRP